MEDSGQIPVTRDGAYRMIRTEIEKFEKDVIARIEEKTDHMTRAFERARGAAWMLGIILALPEMVWVILQIIAAVKR